MRTKTFKETETECIMIIVETFPKYWDGKTAGHNFPISERLFKNDSGFQLISNCFHEIEVIDKELLKRVNSVGEISFPEVCKIWGLSHYKFA